ncbi:hypothetical protein ABHI18_007828 [Aspergillus niger]
MESFIFPWLTTLDGDLIPTNPADFTSSDESLPYLNATAYPVAASAGPMSYRTDIFLPQYGAIFPSFQPAPYQQAVQAVSTPSFQSPIGQYLYPGPIGDRPNAWVNQQQPESSNIEFGSVVQTGMLNQGHNLTHGMDSSEHDDMTEPRYATRNRQAHGAPYT